MKRVYAVVRGRRSGIFESWAECDAQVKGYRGAIFQGFERWDQAEVWMSSQSQEGTDDDNGVLGGGSSGGGGAGTSSSQPMEIIDDDDDEEEEEEVENDKGEEKDIKPAASSTVKKYYAVREGRRPGIYTSWQAAAEQVDGFSGACFRSFRSRAEARLFLRGDGSGDIIDGEDSQGTSSPGEVVFQEAVSLDERHAAGAASAIDLTDLDDEEDEDGGGSGGRRWRCDGCTFINGGSALVCAMCRQQPSSRQDGSWSCERCTALNEPRCGTCTACGYDQLAAAGRSTPPPSQSSGAAAARDLKTWTCGVCTLATNPLNRMECEACGTPRPAGAPSSSSSSSSLSVAAAVSRGDEGSGAGGGGPANAPHPHPHHVPHRPSFPTAPPPADCTTRTRRHVRRNLPTPAYLRKWLATDNPKFASILKDRDQLALMEEIVCRGRNVFLTGSGGVGKSHVTRAVIAFCKAVLYPGETARLAVAASTGIAATHIDGATLHSVAGVGVPNQVGDFNRMRKKVIRDLWVKGLEVLIVDEVSMVSGEFLDHLDEQVRDLAREHLQAAGGGGPYAAVWDAPFAGIQVVFCGDFFQLPPITDKVPRNTFSSLIPEQLRQHVAAWPQVTRQGQRVNVELCLSRGYAFESAVWKAADFTFVELGTIHRQDDRRFIEFLQRARRGRCTGADIAALNAKRRATQNSHAGFVPASCLLSSGPGGGSSGGGGGFRGTRLFAVNRQAIKVNRGMMAQLGTEAHAFVSHDWIAPHNTLLQGQGGGDGQQQQQHPSLSEMGRLRESLWGGQPASAEVDGLGATATAWARGDFFGPKGCPAASELTLKTFAKVMLRANVDQEAKQVNGTQGLVVGWARDARAKEAVKDRLQALELKKAEAPKPLSNDSSDGADNTRRPRATDREAEVDRERFIAMEQQALAAWAEKQSRPLTLPIVRYFNGLDEHAYASDAENAAALHAALAALRRRAPALYAERERLAERIFRLSGHLTATVCIPSLFTSELSGQGSRYRLQLPLHASWAISMHKSQGMSLRELEIDLSHVFARGQSYVALSRAEDAAKMRVAGERPITATQIRPPRQAEIFYDLMKGFNDTAGEISMACGLADDDALARSGGPRSQLRRAEKLCRNREELSRRRGGGGGGGGGGVDISGEVRVLRETLEKLEPWRPSEQAIDAGGREAWKDVETCDHVRHWICYPVQQQAETFRNEP